ncbi:hypothetical protein B0H14DRAFT_2873545 [Mycena olivaceomarginata]|nr:hypothetical protein B0H14DRAFT_2873545 [Mycena olivaceomarginata]
MPLITPPQCFPTCPSRRGPMRARPRGLWKGGKSKQTLDFDAPRPAKRHRSEDTSSEDDSFEGYYLLEYSPEPSECSIMDTSHLEDWEDLKELFARAAEQYEGDDVNEALSLLRGVIHESARFLLLYEDPSLLTPEPLHSICSPTTPKKKCTCRESPTAFHALLGTALFLFGNLIAQDPSLALPNEPSFPATYWLAALDVFETGENLPSRTSGRGWSSPTASPFAAIAMRRPPASHRIVLATAAPHDLLLLAMDHFARGMFHMPRNVPTALPGAAPAPAFNRASELFTIAREQIRVQTDAVAHARGRCWLVVGTARVEDIEAMAEARGWACGGIFERAMHEGAEALDEEKHAEAEELRAFLVEALLTLANFTKEEDKREALYRRAQLLGGEALEGMEMDEDER